MPSGPGLSRYCSTHDPRDLGQYQLAVEIQPVPHHVYAGDSRSYDIVMRRGD